MNLNDPPLHCQCGQNATLRVSISPHSYDTNGNEAVLLAYRCRCGADSGPWMLEGQAAQAFRMQRHLALGPQSRDSHSAGQK